MSWLRELCAVADDADAVARALTNRGLTVDDVIRAGADTVLDVDVPANRPDCLGHLGIARELSAAFGLPLAPPPRAVATVGRPVESSVRVEVDAPDLCPRYTARVVREVRVSPSPPWVVERLLACGMRPVNNVVDASNLVMLALGQPIHAFDLDRLDEATIRVRRARGGEVLTTLDGTTRSLDAQMLVIADAHRPVAVAGIMGGADSEIRGATKNVLVEAAAFGPATVRSTARRLALRTDASHRFERGIDTEGIPAAQDLMVRLVAELAQGSVAPGEVDVDSRSPARRELVLRLDRVPLLLGFDPGSREVHAALDALGLSPAQEGPGRVRIVVPSWRRDLEREADVVEEVARHIGYERIPLALPGASAVPRQPTPEAAVQERCRDLLAALGFREATNYAMLAAGEDDAFVAPSSPPAMAIDNPLSEQLAVLRRSLLPGLVRCADRNARRGAEDVRLFEVGGVFVERPEGRMPLEPLRAGIVWAGAGEPRHWSRTPREARFHDLAGVVEAALAGLRPGSAFRRGKTDIPALHPVRSAGWRGPDGRIVARGGELHPGLSGALDLRADLLVAEVDLQAVLEIPWAEPRHTPLPRLPAVSRDLSLVVTDGLDFDLVLDALRRTPAPSAVEFGVIDRYVGEGLAPGEASVTVRVMLQPFERSLTDPEIEAYRAELVRAVEDGLGIRLRS